MTALVLLLAAPAVAPLASAGPMCPEASITSPTAGALVIAVGGVPVTIHTCLQFSYTITIRNSGGGVLGTVTGDVAAPCGHGDTMTAVTWAGPYVGAATVELTTVGCFFGSPPATVSILLIKV